MSFVSVSQRSVQSALAAVVTLSVGLIPMLAGELPLPPSLPGGQSALRLSGAELLRATSKVREGVQIAASAPVVDFLYYPDQTHPGSPWSNWGDGTCADGIYYSAVGDHQKPRGTAHVYTYDPKRRELRLLVDLRRFLEDSDLLRPNENYTPGKIHTRIDLGSDGWLYYAGHRGSTRTTDDAHGFRGERLFRTHSQSGTTEIVAAFPIPKHVIPMGLLDRRRMIFYGGTAPGKDADRREVWFFAYDVRNRKLLKEAAHGPDRCAILSESSGRVYWKGHRYDPETNTIEPLPHIPHIRSATRETANGFVYGTSGRSAELWAFQSTTEQIEVIGDGAVGEAAYITSIDVDPHGRYLYYVPGAHGRAERDGTPVVQFDLVSKRRKIIAFLNPFLKDRTGYTPIGTFSSALSPEGDKLFVTWNGYRDGAPDQWDVCALTIIHIPPEERMRE